MTVLLVIWTVIVLQTIAIHRDVPASHKVFKQFFILCLLEKRSKMFILQPQPIHHVISVLIAYRTIASLTQNCVTRKVNEINKNCILLEYLCKHFYCFLTKHQMACHVLWTMTVFQDSVVLIDQILVSIKVMKFQLNFVCFTWVYFVSLKLQMAVAVYSILIVSRTIASQTQCCVTRKVTICFIFYW